MKIRYDVISDVGRVRANNEDMALVFGAFIRDDAQRSMVPMRSRPRFTALIADGMGGYGGGEIASEMTLRSFDRFISAVPSDMSAREMVQAVKDWFRMNQDEVLARAATSEELRSMGTTLTGFFTYGPWEFMLNAGDSRVYRWRYETLRQLSTDHSERERTGDPAVPPNLIYNAVGVPGAFVDVTNITDEMPMIDGDVYVICSDGLCDMVSDDGIAEILSRGGGARELVDAALDAGGRDNCTVIVLHVSIPEEDEESPQPETAEEPETAPVGDGAAEAPAQADVIEKPCAALPPDYEVGSVIAFTIDSDEADEPECIGAKEESEPVPPPFNPADMPVGSDDGYEEITEEEARMLPPGNPTAGERAKAASRKFREAWELLIGKKK